MLDQQLRLQRAGVVVVDPSSLLVGQFRLMPVIGVVLKEGDPAIQPLDHRLGDSGFARAGATRDADEQRPIRLPGTAIRHPATLMTCTSLGLRLLLVGDLAAKTPDLVVDPVGERG